MSDTKNVTASKPGISGAIRMAPIGTALPKTVDEELDQAYVTLGYISEDGYANGNSGDSSSVKGWGGQTIFEGETSKPDTFKMKYMEYLNPDVCKMVYGDENVDTYEDGSLKEIHANNAEVEPRVFVIDERLKDGRKARTVIPDGKPKLTEDITHKDGDPIGYGVEISAMPSELVKNKNGLPDTHATYFSRKGE
ncbi:MAG: phage tail protein [Lachnospiraceae bacterium]|nr:phage tail protein [Lachnospiraceae bacterium]